MRTPTAAAGRMPTPRRGPEPQLPIPAGAQDGVYESRSGGPPPEPETQAIQRFVERSRRVTIWYHQAMSLVVRSAGDAGLQRRYSRSAACPAWPAGLPWNGQLLGELDLPRHGLRRSSCRPGGCRPWASPATPRRCWPWPGRRRRASSRSRSPTTTSARPTCGGYARHYGSTTTAAQPAVIVEHYTVTDTLPARLRHVRAEPCRRRAGRAGQGSAATT